MNSAMYGNNSKLGVNNIDLDILNDVEGKMVRVISKMSVADKKEYLRIMKTKWRQFQQDYIAYKNLWQKRKAEFVGVAKQKKLEECDKKDFTFLKPALPPARKRSAALVGADSKSVPASTGGQSSVALKKIKEVRDQLQKSPFLVPRIPPSIHKKPSISLNRYQKKIVMMAKKALLLYLCTSNKSKLDMRRCTMNFFKCIREIETEQLRRVHKSEFLKYLREICKEGPNNIPNSKHRTSRSKVENPESKQICPVSVESNTDDADRLDWSKMPVWVEIEIYTDAEGPCKVSVEIAPDGEKGL